MSLRLLFRGTEISKHFHQERLKLLTAEIIKSWIVRDLGEGKNQPAHRILQGRLSRKTYLLFRFSIILRYFLKSEKSKHGPSVEFLEIKGVDRPM